MTVRLDEVFGRAIDERRVPGAVAIVGDSRGTTFLKAYGERDVTSGEPLGPDALFRIASFTKAVVAVAVLQLVERGDLALDVPVGDIIPAFDKLRVLEGFDGDVPRLRAPRRRATLRHLMTHTSGLTYDAFSDDLLRYGEITGVPMPSSGLEACFETPLLFDPGERFAYGMSSDWTGQVVEAVSGEALADYLTGHVFEPLGLTDICFSLTDEQRRRLAPVHLRTGDGSFSPNDFEWPSEPEFDSAGHGLYSTATDFLTMQRLLLGRGAADGVRLVRPETIGPMFESQLDGVYMEPMPSSRPDFTYALDAGRNATWGLDIMVTAYGEPGLRPPGSVGWCGTFNTFYWVDFRNDLAAALYMQYLPLFDPAAMQLAQEFERAVYEGR